MFVAALCIVSTFAQSADDLGAAAGGTASDTNDIDSLGFPTGNPSGGGTDMGNSIAGTTGDFSGTAGESMGTDSSNTTDDTEVPAAARNSTSSSNLDGGYATSASGG
jgi:hypothetical protein